MSDTIYKVQFIHGKRIAGVDECDQGWLNVRLDKSIDCTNLLQVVNECFALEQAGDGAFTYRTIVITRGEPARLVA